MDLVLIIENKRNEMKLQIIKKSVIFLVKMG